MLHPVTEVRECACVTVSGKVGYARDVPAGLRCVEYTRGIAIAKTVYQCAQEVSHLRISYFTSVTGKSTRCSN